VAETARVDSLRIVSPRYGSDVIGGAERLARMLAVTLHAAGWHVEVFTTRARDAATWRNALPAGESVEDGVSVQRHTVGMRRRPRTFHQISRAFFRLPPRHRPEGMWLTLQGPWSPALVQAVRTAPAMPTLFLPYLYYPTLVGLPLCPGPRILMPAGHDERPLRLRAVGRAISAAGALWYGTEEEQEIVERAHPQARDKPSAVGNVGIVAPERVDAGSFRAHASSLGLPPDAPYLVYGGRAATGKGMEDLLDGFRRLRARRPEVRLVLTGEAGRAPRAPRQKQEEGVVAAGMLDEAMRWNALAGAAAVVVPSFHESLSLLALEAWAVGRPVLANAESPALLGQVLRSGGGIGYRGAEELATAAGDLLSDTQVAEALGRSGQRWVALTYRWEVVHARLARLIDEAAG
jgi:glycosyltransferase involved in cell wall biosynthesis